MPCSHRFIKELIPQEEELEFLFIGTFNPIWPSANGNNADYFYGRNTNQFWCIMPHAFEKHCLIDKEITEWKLFCQSNKIGLTDLIRCVINADETNNSHVRMLTNGFNDQELDKEENGFDLDFATTEIIKLFDSNKNTLKGVFFTRSSKQGINKIWSEWDKITRHCEILNIYNAALLSPSPIVKIGIKEKITRWKAQIKNANVNFKAIS